MLKNWSVLVVILMLGNTVLAQQQTLFGNGMTAGGYAGLTMSSGPSAEGVSPFLGVEGMLSLNHCFELGMGFRGLVEEPMSPFSEEQRYSLGYGGMMVGMNLLPQQLVHLNLHLLVGGGSLISYFPKHDHDDWTEPYWSDKRLEEHHWDEPVTFDGFYAVEPGITMVMNFHSLVRIGAGVNYRSTHGIESLNMTDADWDGITPHLIIRVGKF